MENGQTENMLISFFVDIQITDWKKMSTPKLPAEKNVDMQIIKSGNVNFRNLIYGLHEYYIYR
jgi:hypothetical protein